MKRACTSLTSLHISFVFCSSFSYLVYWCCVLLVSLLLFGSLIMVIKWSMKWAKWEEETRSTQFQQVPRYEKETKKRMKRIKRAVFHHLPLFGSCFFWVFLVCSLFRSLYLVRLQWNKVEAWTEPKKKKGTTTHPTCQAVWFFLFLCIQFNSRFLSLPLQLNWIQRENKGHTRPRSAVSQWLIPLLVIQLA